MMARPVGVDVTAHKEERNVAAANSRKKPKLRVRYYVELVVGSPREGHMRLGFSGTFKALLALHHEFAAVHAAVRQQSTRASASSSPSTSRSSSSLSSSPPKGIKRFFAFATASQHRRSSEARASSTTSSDEFTGSNQLENDENPIVPFPAKSIASKMMLHLEVNEAEDDAKITERTQALFEYYTRLFNTPYDGEIFIEIVQHRSAEGQSGPETSQQQPRLLSLLSKVQTGRTVNGKKVEFLPPVHVHVKSRRPHGTRRSTTGTRTHG